MGESFALGYCCQAGTS
jgi:hypothetical protein